MKKLLISLGLSLSLSGMASGWTTGGVTATGGSPLGSTYQLLMTVPANARGGMLYFNTIASNVCLNTTNYSTAIPSVTTNEVCLLANTNGGFSPIDSIPLGTNIFIRTQSGSAGSGSFILNVW